MSTKLQGREFGSERCLRERVVDLRFHRLWKSPWSPSKLALSLLCYTIVVVVITSSSHITQWTPSFTESEHQSHTRPVSSIFGSTRNACLTGSCSENGLEQTRPIERKRMMVDQCGRRTFETDNGLLMAGFFCYEQEHRPSATARSSGRPSTGLPASPALAPLHGSLHDPLRRRNVRYHRRLLQHGCRTYLLRFFNFVCGIYVTM
ncbi:zinc finger protein [Pseudozyma hubeiensis SY62]|uniref:Zinc finger protein n=1 Tax=Pseudozyma hubeiensis (strain SY62) TaxID=1305764 RepID=R9P778_PSEHS|nr:zinc finger protein [Pseudozyma hubeiensis SY62]GAC97107.1 zinc finger protein [Pseudozyma hubeiensis SY62]